MMARSSRGVGNAPYFRMLLIASLLTLGAGLLGATPAAAIAVPGAPTNVSVMPWQKAGKVTFTAPANNGAAIEEYGYQIVTGGPWIVRSPMLTSTTFWLGDLLLSSYQVRVRARNAAGWGAPSAVVDFTPYNTGARFVPTYPTRVYDSRTPGDQVGGRMAGIGQYPVKYRQVSVSYRRDVDSGDLMGQVVPEGAVAVAVNVTAIDTAGDGFVSVQGTGPIPAKTSSINWSGSTTIANGLQVSLDQNPQTVLLYVGGGGSAHVAIDVLGYYLPTSDPTSLGAGGAYTSLASPLRAVDTRSNGGPLGAGQTRVVNLDDIGAGIIPSTAQGVTYNLTVPNPVTAGFLDVEAFSSNVIHASTINWTKAPDEIIANASILRLDQQLSVGDRHKVRVFSGMGANTNFIIDVTGYYLPSAGAPAEQVFFPLYTPMRILDTRAPAPSPGKIITGTNRVLSVSSAYNDAGQVVDPYVIPATGNSKSVAINVTVADTVGPGFLSVTPSSVSVAPGASSINWASTGTLRANAITSGVTLGFFDKRNIRVFAGGGAWTNVIIDLYGYYAEKPSGPP